MADRVAAQIIARTLEGRRANPDASAMDLLDAAFAGRHGLSLDFGEPGSRFGSALDPREAFGQMIVEAFDRGMEPSDWIALLRDDGDPRVRRSLLQVYESDVLQRFAGRYRLWGAAERVQAESRPWRSLRTL